MAGGYDVGNLGLSYGNMPDYNAVSSYVGTQGFPDVGGGGGASAGGAWYENIPQLLGGVGNIARSFQGGGTGAIGAMGYGGMDLEEYDPEPVEEATKKVNTEYEKMLSQIGGIFNDIAYLTGTNVPTAVNAFRQRYADYIEPAAQRGYNMLFNYEPGDMGKIPISEYGDKAVDKVFGTASDFSALNRANYMNQARNPQTVTIDPQTFQPQFNKYKQDAKSGDMYDYTSAATKALIDAPDVPKIDKIYDREVMGRYYANSPDVDKLMTFGGYFDAK